MSAPVLMNLKNEFGKRDKMRGLPSILSLFRSEFIKFNKLAVIWTTHVERLLIG